MKKLLEIRIEEPIYPKSVAYFKPLIPWLLPGRYTVVRDFDETKYVIRCGYRSITIVDKSLCKVV